MDCSPASVRPPALSSSHYALVDSGIPPLYGATLRLATGTLVIALWLAVHNRQALLELPAKLYQQSGRLRLVLGILVGTYLALWLQQIALKPSNPAVAQTLLATSPLLAATGTDPRRTAGLAPDIRHADLVAGDYLLFLAISQNGHSYLRWITNDEHR